MVAGAADAATLTDHKAMVEIAFWIALPVYALLTVLKLKSE